MTPYRWLFIGFSTALLFLGLLIVFLAVSEHVKARKLERARRQEEKARRRQRKAEEAAPRGAAADAHQRADRIRSRVQEAVERQRQRGVDRQTAMVSTFSRIYGVTPAELSRAGLSPEQREHLSRQMGEQLNRTAVRLNESLRQIDETVSQSFTTMDLVHERLQAVLDPHPPLQDRPGVDAGILGRLPPTRMEDFGGELKAILNVEKVKAAPKAEEPRPDRFSRILKDDD